MFQILNGGYFTKHPQSFSLERPLGVEYFVFLCIRSEAKLCISGKHYTVAPNSYLFIQPHIPYSYSNPEGMYMDDWIHFTCTQEDIAQLPTQIFHQPFPCNNPTIVSTYIEQLLWEKNFTPDSFRTENVHQLFHIILRHALQDFSNRRTYNPHHFQMQKQRMTMQSAPYINYQSGTLAKSIGISSSYYEHLYKEIFGQSFRADLISMRINYAKDLIKNTALPFEQIAQLCGYNSEVHFYRQFLAKTGTTPGQFKHMNTISENQIL